MPDKKTSLLWLLVGSIIGATLCAIFFLKRPGVDHWKMNPPQAAFWDIAVKGFTAVLAITGASLAVIKYFSDREEHNAPSGTRVLGINGTESCLKNPVLL